MTTINDGGPAFPRDERYLGHNGMSLRDYFAAKAIQAKLGATGGRFPIPYPILQLMAKDAYDMADAMLAAREKT